MSESEHSYYEIALTNRQALVAFAVLLGVVLVAFFSGVWVAREGAATRAGQVVSEDGPEPALGTSPLRPEPELDRVARAADTSTTLVEDVTGRRPAAPSTGSAPATSGAEGEVDPEPVGLLARAADPEPIEEPAASEPAPEAAAPTPSPRTPSRPGATAPTAPAAAPVAADGAFVVQVLATGDRAKAEGLMRRLEAAGYAAFLSPLGAGAQTTYRVRLGPFETREAALPVQARVDRQFKVESWITAP